MNKRRKGRVYETGRGIFKYRVSINGEAVYLPLMATNRADAENEAGQYKERVQGGSEAVADALRALADRLEGKGVLTGDCTPQQAWMGFVEGHSAKDRTIQFYEGVWIKFCRWLESGGIADLGGVKERQAAAYLKHLESGDALAGSTINKHLMALRLIWKKGVGCRGPWEGMKSQRRSAQVRHLPFSADELRVILNRGDKDLTALLSVMAYTGMGLVDACTMDCSSVYWQRGVIEYARVKTENRGQEAILSKVGIHPAITPLLRDRMSGGAVFPYWAERYKGDYTRIVREIQAHLNDCGLETSVCVRGKRQCRYGSHSFRHTVQTMLANADIHTSVIDVILGHRTPGMGAIYTHVSDKRVQDAIAVIPDVLRGGKVIALGA